MCWCLMLVSHVGDHDVMQEHDGFLRLFAQVVCAGPYTLTEAQREAAGEKVR